VQTNDTFMSIVHRG